MAREVFIEFSELRESLEDFNFKKKTQELRGRTIKIYFHDICFVI